MPARITNWAGKHFSKNAFGMTAEKPIKKARRP